MEIYNEETKLDTENIEKEEKINNSFTKKEILTFSLGILLSISATINVFMGIKNQELSNDVNDLRTILIDDAKAFAKAAEVLPQLRVNLELAEMIHDKVLDDALKQTNSKYLDETYFKNEENLGGGE